MFNFFKKHKVKESKAEYLKRVKRGFTPKKNQTIKTDGFGNTIIRTKVENSHRVSVI